MATRLTPDICIIGGGAGGTALAREAAHAGASVVLVEQDEPGGGPVRHAMPLQALLAAARHAQAMRHGARFGIVDAAPEIDFRRLMRHLREAAAATAQNSSAARLAALGVMVVTSQARFADRRTLSAEGQEIRARHFVIATGARPVAPSFPGLDAVDVLMPETVTTLNRKPTRLVVIGGDAYGLAFAQAWRRLGCDVVAIQPEAALGAEDPEQAAIVLAAMRMEGVEIRERTSVLRAERRGKTGVRIIVAGAEGREEQIDGSHLLFIADRAPAVDGLDLAKAGIAFSPAGIEVNAELRTTNRRVYAVGDATGGPRSIYLAQHQAALVAGALLSGKRAEAGPTAVPRAIFTSPQIAAIGLGEAEAKARHGRIRVLRWPLAENERMRAEASTGGFIKLIADQRGRILGVSIASAEASELIGVWELAMNNGLDMAEMAAHMPPHPTFAEIGKHAAISYFQEAARKPGVRRFIRFPRIFG